MKKQTVAVLLAVLMMSFAVTGFALSINTWNSNFNLQKDYGNYDRENTVFDNWIIEYYVDEFKQKTDEGYITNYHMLTGTFSNSAASDEKLKIEWIIDEETVAVKLYEYGSYLVKGYSTTNYSVTMRDAEGKDTELTASQKDGQDRIFFGAESANLIRKALNEHSTVSFFMQNKRRATETYLFTVSDTEGFCEAWEKLTGKEMK